jgi:hypothetical protein
MENLHAKSPTDDSLVTTSIPSLGVFLLLMVKQAPITSGIFGFGCYGALALQWVIPLIWQIIKMDPRTPLMDNLWKTVGIRGVVCGELVAFHSAIKHNTRRMALKMMPDLKHPS